MNASLVYPADMPFLVGVYAYHRLAQDMAEALGFPVALCPLPRGTALPDGPVIAHATPELRPLQDAADRTVIVNADPAHLSALLASRPLALVTLAAMAVWRVEPDQAASAGIWVRGDALARIDGLAEARVSEREPYAMIAPQPKTALVQVLAALLTGHDRHHSMPPGLSPSLPDE